MMDEKAYMLGQQAVALKVVQELRQYLPEEETELSRAQSVLIESRLVLSGIFEAIGHEDEFDPGLHLADLCRRLDKLLR